MAKILPLINTQSVSDVDRDNKPYQFHC